MIPKRFIASQEVANLDAYSCSCRLPNQPHKRNTGDWNGAFAGFSTMVSKWCEMDFVIFRPSAGKPSTWLELGPQQICIYIYMYAWLVDNKGNPKKAKKKHRGANSGEVKRPPKPTAETSGCFAKPQRARHTPRVSSLAPVLRIVVFPLFFVFHGKLLLTPFVTSDGADWTTNQSLGTDSI